MQTWNDYGLSQSEVEDKVKEVLALLNKKLGKNKFKLDAEQFYPDKCWVKIRDVEVEQAFLDTVGQKSYQANSAFDARSSFHFFIIPLLFSPYRYEKDRIWQIEYTETLEFKILARIGATVWDAYKRAIDTSGPFEPAMLTPDAVHKLYT